MTGENGPAPGRSALLAAAKRHFAEQGYHGASLSRIAAGARASKGNIFVRPRATS